MQLIFQVPEKSPAQVYAALSDLGHFVAIHPLIEAMSPLPQAGRVKVEERVVLFGFWPRRFEYEAELCGDASTLTWQVSAKVAPLTWAYMDFQVRAAAQGAEVEEFVRIESRLPLVKAYMQKVIRQQHGLMFERLRSYEALNEQNNHRPE